MQTITLIWLATSLLAAAMLLSMLRRRQIQLSGLLKAYVQEQIAWSRKKSRAGRVVRRAAEQQAAEQQAAPEAMPAINDPAGKALPELNAADVQAASNAVAELAEQATDR